MEQPGPKPFASATTWGDRVQLAAAHTGHLRDHVDLLQAERPNRYDRATSAVQFRLRKALVHLAGAERALSAAAKRAHDIELSW
ncbi:hypothetical protein LCGC14_2848870 [marine sediment metagenome]|uniref:Uncharacterized protein n=1 Tax=marine sediment metagenome TaxID=412755 RepID=A0A0F8Y942_9ZZZZ